MDALHPTPRAVTAESASRQPAGASARLRGALPPILLAAGFALAFGHLVGFDPDAQLRGHVRGLEGWLFSPNGDSPAFLLGVTAVLLYMRYPMLRAGFEGPAAPWAAAAFALPAVALHAWGEYVDGPQLHILSLSLALLAAGAALSGRRGIAAASVPAALLLLAVPLPAAWINEVVFPLQLAVARVAAWMVRLFGISAVTSGELILTPGAVFQVIESCSGLRSISTLTMAAVLYGQLFRTPRARALLLVALAPAVGLFVNQLRVLSIIFVPHSDVWSVHLTQGLVMIVVGVLLIAALDTALARWLPERSGERARVRRGQLPRWSRVTVVLVGLLGLWLARVVIDPWPIPNDDRRSLVSLPMALSHLRTKGSRVDDQHLGSVRFSERTALEFDHSDRRVRLFVGIDDRRSPFQSGRSDKTLLPGSGWWVRSRTRADFEPAGPVDLAIVERQGAQRMVVRWERGIGSLGEETLRALLGLDRSPLRRTAPAAVVRLEVPLRGDADHAAAKQALRAAIAELYPLLAPFGAT